MEKDPDVAEGINNTRFRMLDSRIGRWMSVDPAAHLYYSWSPYNLSADNPIMNSDPSGATIVDGKHEVITSQDVNGNNVYKRADGSNVSKRFMKKAAPVLDAMAKTQKGIDDIEYLSTIPTKVRISAKKGSNTLVNSWVNYGGTKNGYYKKVSLTPFLGNHNSNKGDFDEWLGSIMTVETGHLEPDQIILDQNAKSSKADYLQVSSSPEFQTSYYPLLNRATEYRIRYRIKYNQTITKDAFVPLDVHKMKYDAYNSIALYNMKYGKLKTIDPIDSRTIQIKSRQ